MTNVAVDRTVRGGAPACEKYSAMSIIESVSDPFEFGTTTCLLFPAILKGIEAQMDIKSWCYLEMHQSLHPYSIPRIQDETHFAVIMG